MKTAITTTLATLLAIGVGTAFAGNLQNTSRPSMQTPPAASQPAAPADPANACTSKWPSFSQIDTKHAGHITRKEARHVPGLKKAFKKADTDNNGKLDQAEYTAWVQSMCTTMDQQSQGQTTPPPV